MKLFELLAKSYYEYNIINEPFSIFFKNFIKDNKELFYYIETQKMYNNGFAKWLKFAEPEEIEELIYDFK